MKRPNPTLSRILITGLVCVVIMQLLRSAPVNRLIRTVTTPEFVSAVLFLGTGRTMHLPEAEAPTQPTQPQTPANTLQFQPEDAQNIKLYNYAGVAIDTQSALMKPLTWDLTADAPTVLIYHTHASESYRNTENYPESSAYRTLDQRYNMISIGQRLAQRLETAGIRVIHDTTIHDYPSYNGAYTSSRQTVQQYLAQYPSIRLVLDIHRDAYEDSNGNQASSTVTLHGQQTARIMIVTGTNAGGESHPNWAENLALAVKLQAVLEADNAGFCRPLCIRSSAFNQFLSPGALLVEVGTAGDTRQSALAAADLLAESIIRLANGTA